MSMTPTSVAAILSQQTDEVFVALLTISDPSLSDDVRVSSDNHDMLPVAQVRGTVSRSKEYIFYPFDINLPVDSDDIAPSMTLSIDNVHRDIVKTLRAISTAPSVKLEVVRAEAPDTVEKTLDGFDLSVADYDELIVKGELTMESLLTEPYPADLFVPSSYPGLF